MYLEYDKEAEEKAQARKRAAEKRERIQSYVFVVKDGRRRVSVHMCVDEAMLNREPWQTVEVMEAG